MPRLTPEFKEQIKGLTTVELQQIVLKLAAKDKVSYDFILVNYLDKDGGEQELFDEAINDLNMLFMKGYRGYSVQIRMANMLQACTKRIDEFCKVSNNKKLEADLLMYVLKEPFSLPVISFGTCFSQFDHKVAQLVRRLITIVTKKLHEDYKMDYNEKINQYLLVLHARSRHNDLVYKMPREI
jgi:hypothetical protein